MRFLNIIDFAPRLSPQIGAIAKVLEGRKKDLSPNASARSFFLVRTSDSSSPILGNVGDFSAFFDSVPEDEVGRIY